MPTSAGVTRTPPARRTARGGSYRGSDCEGRGRNSPTSNDSWWVEGGEEDGDILFLISKRPYIGSSKILTQRSPDNRLVAVSMNTRRTVSSHLIILLIIMIVIISIYWH